MKKTFLLSALMFLVLNSNSFSQKVKFGLKFDPQFSWLAVRSSNIESKGSHFGIDGGLVMDYFFEENYALSIGASISSVGGGMEAKENFNLEIEDSVYQIVPGQELKLRMQYISIPIGLKFKTREFGATTVFAQIGLTTQFNIGAKTKATDNIPEGDINPETSFMDLGYHIGAGVLYSLGGNTALSAGIIFKNGFIDVASTNEFSIVLNTLSIRIGVMF